MGKWKVMLEQVGNDAEKFQIPETAENQLSPDDIKPPGDDGEMLSVFFLKLKEMC